MGHFAKVVDGYVTQVIVAEPEFFDNFVDTSAGEWIQTSYNTHGGVHLLGGTPLRKNFAGLGYKYDKNLDAFIPPKEYDSWVLNEDTCLYEAPIAKPVYEGDDNEYIWDESIKNWKLRF